MRPSFREEGRLPPQPKPYRFLPLAEEGVIRRPPPGHHTYDPERHTGTIEGMLTALSPVHVASGNVELTGSTPSLVKAHFRRNGIPTLPGSSLKGAIRSIVEAISDPPSCVRISQRKLEHRIPTEHRACGMVRSRGREPRGKDPRGHEPEICLACALFGALGYQGRVGFRDAPLEVADAEKGATQTIQIPPLFAPREESYAYQQDGKLKGRKFYRHGRANGEPSLGSTPIEACPKGARFPLRVEFEDLSRSELGLLLTALGQGQPALTLKLGGGKPACCGSVRVEPIRVQAFPVAALEFDVQPQQLDPAELLAGSERVHTERLAKLAEILAFPGEEPCPDRNY